MQVLVSSPHPGERPTRFAVARPAGGAAILLASALWVLWAVFRSGLLDEIGSDQATTYGIVAGVLTWAFAISAPPAFGLLAYSWGSLALARMRARRPRVTPAVRLRRALGDDHIVATDFRLPDGSRILPELVIGPFGAAVIEEVPPSEAVVSRGSRTWEVRVGTGHVRTIEHPLARATRDAERVQAWLSGNNRDERIPVYAAVVGRDPRLGESEFVMVLAADQVADWLKALPAHAPLDAGRRERIVGMIRAAL